MEHLPGVFLTVWVTRSFHLQTPQCFPQNHFLSTPVRGWLEETEAFQSNQIVLSRSSLAYFCEENSHVFQELRA